MPLLIILYIPFALYPPYCQTLGGVKPSPSGDSFSGVRAAVKLKYGIPPRFTHSFRDTPAYCVDDEISEESADGGGGIAGEGNHTTGV